MDSLQVNIKSSSYLCSAAWSVLYTLEFNCHSELQPNIYTYVCVNPLTIHLKRREEKYIYP